MFYFRHFLFILSGMGHKVYLSQKMPQNVTKMQDKTKNNLEKAVIIEYSHIYAGEPITQEHIVGAETAKQVSEILKGNNIPYTGVVMIDDLNKTTDNLEGYTKQYVDFLSKYLKPDYVTYEKSCIPGADKLLESIPDTIPGNNGAGKHWKNEKLYVYPKDSRKIKVYDGKHHCPLLAAVLDSSKLGAFEIDKTKVSDNSAGFIGGYSLVILPGFYKKVEEHAMLILQTSQQYKDFTKKIGHIWIKDSAASKEELEKQLTEMKVINYGN